MAVYCGKNGFWRRFRRDERGNFAIILGLIAIPLFGLVGLGIDLTRAYIAQVRLQGAVDSAALAAAGLRGKDEDIIIEVTRNYFLANYDEGFWAPATEPDIQVVNGDVTISASASLETYFFRLLGEPTFDLAVSAGAISEVRGLEVVLVLDVTGSMFFNSQGGQTRLEAMKDAALQLVDILYDANREPGMLRIGIVPYNATVNIGTNMSGYALNTSTPQYFPNTSWQGCVMERRGNHDTTDVYVNRSGENGRQGKWYAYKWPVEPNQIDPSTPEVSNCINRGTAPGTGTVGDPRNGGTSTTTQVDRFGRVHKYTIDYFTEGYFPREMRGPNMACPQPVLPLTSDRVTVDQRLRDLDVVFYGGTITSVGAIWGLRLISPTEPFTQGVAYSNEQWDKVIIVLTDGEQELAGDDQPPTPWDCRNADTVQNTAWNYRPGDYGTFGNNLTTGTDFNFTTYGYLFESRPFGSGNYVTRLQQRLQRSCNSIKSIYKPDGTRAITLYTITFGDHLAGNSGIRTLMEGCASTPNEYFHAPNNDTLRDVFEEIAFRLANTRLTR